VHREPDGDVHIELHLGRAYRHLLTPANTYQRCRATAARTWSWRSSRRNGELPFPDNSATRAGFVTPKAPMPGQHVKVAGPYVWTPTPCMT
jgi:hypothetical protein